MSMQLETLDVIYDGANAKWVRNDGSVTVSYNEHVEVTAEEYTQPLGVLGQKYISMAVTLNDLPLVLLHTLDAKIQYSLDNSTWADLTDGGITQLTDEGTNTVEAKTLPDCKSVRVAFTLSLSGTNVNNADITFKIITTQ